MDFQFTQCDKSYKITLRRIVRVRTFTSSLHEILNRLFERIEHIDNSSDKYIAARVRVYKTPIRHNNDNAYDNNYQFTEISFTHFHSILFEPCYAFIIKKLNKTIHYDTEFMDNKRYVSNRTR